MAHPCAITLRFFGGNPLQFDLEDFVPVEDIDVRLSLARSDMADEPGSFQRGNVAFDLARGLCQIARHGFNAAPEGTVPARPAHGARVQSFLRIRQPALTVAVECIRREKPAGAMPWIKDIPRLLWYLTHVRQRSGCS